MFRKADSGLYLTQYRAYDPIAGRWLSRDPIGEMSDRVGNLYVYVGGDPVSSTDPLGLWTFQIGCTYGYTKGGMTGFYFRGFAVDSSGNFGVYSGVEGGPAIGAGGSFSLSVEESNAETIYGLHGPFVNASRGGGWVSFATGDAFYGKYEGKRVIDGGISYGLGLGSTSFVGVTRTDITAIGRISR